MAIKQALVIPPAVPRLPLLPGDARDYDKRLNRALYDIFREPLSLGLRWDDLRFPAQGINPLGASAPPSIDVDTAKFPGTLLFAGNLDNEIAGIAQMPHSWFAGSAIKPHIHWSKPVGSANAVSWRFYYRIVGSVGDTSGAWSAAISGTLDAGVQTTADTHLFSSFGEIVMTGYKESSIVAWRVVRLGSSDADSGTARLFEFDIHYQATKLGTVTEIPP